jgi:hypothetical protein
MSFMTWFSMRSGPCLIAGGVCHGLIVMSLVSSRWAAGASAGRN